MKSNTKAKPKELTAQRKTRRTPQRLKPSSTEALYFALHSQDSLMRAEAEALLAYPIAGTHLGFAGTDQELVAWCDDRRWNRHGGIFGVQSNGLTNGDLGDEVENVSTGAAQTATPPIDRESIDNEDGSLADDNLDEQDTNAGGYAQRALPYKYSSWLSTSRKFVRQLRKFTDHDPDRAKQYAETVSGNVSLADNQRGLNLIQFAASKRGMSEDAIMEFAAFAWEQKLEPNNNALKLWEKREKNKRYQKPEPLDRTHTFVTGEETNQNVDARDVDFHALSYNRQATAPFSAGRTTAQRISRKKGRVQVNVPYFLESRLRTNADRESDLELRKSAIRMVERLHPDALPMFIDQMDGLTVRQIAEKHGVTKTTAQRTLDRLLCDVFPAYRAKRDADTLERGWELHWEEREREAASQGYTVTELEELEWELSFVGRCDLPEPTIAAF